MFVQKSFYAAYSNLFLVSRIDMIANYVRVDIDPGKGIYEYEVRFDPTVDSKSIRFQLLNQHRDKIGIAKTFDGVTLYLPHQFENNVKTVLFFDPLEM